MGRVEKEILKDYEFTWSLTVADFMVLVISVFLTEVISGVSSYAYNRGFF